MQPRLPNIAFETFEPALPKPPNHHWALVEQSLEAASPKRQMIPMAMIGNRVQLIAKPNHTKT